MLKGHAKIELTDVNTGKIQTYQHRNLVTNAVAENISEIAKIVAYNKVNDLFLPLNKQAMGGILLFQNELTESADNIALPSLIENPTVGYASNDAYSGEDTKRGSRNVNESGLTEQGYKLVWDFATSQANGNISALALTSEVCGASPHNFNSKMDIQSFPRASEDLSRTIEYDFNNNILTILNITTSNSVEIKKIRIPIDRIGLTTILGTPEEISIEKYVIYNDVLNINTESMWINGDDGYYYILYANNSKNILICRISKSTFKFDETYGMQTLVVNSNVLLKNTVRNAAILNGYIYIMYGTSIHKININDFNDYQTVTTLESMGTSAAAILNNVIYTGRYVIFEDLSVIKRTSTYGTWLNTPGSDNVLFLNNNGLFIVVNNQYYITYGTTYNYLATINNLDTPITKTSAQSMKITYTLTEV